MKFERVSIPVCFDLSFLRIRWSDRVLAKDGNKIVGEGVVYGGNWAKAEKLSRQMADMKFGTKRRNLKVCEQIFLQKTKSKKQKAELKKEIEAIKNRGSNLKVKVGRNVIQDIKVIKFIRQELKFPNQIRIDANQGYSLKQLQYLIPTLKQLGIVYIEEPVKVKDLQTASELLHRYGLKIILDESLNDPDVLRTVLRVGGLSFSDVINIKLSRIGDINDALGLIKLSKKKNIKVVIGCSEELERGMEAIYALGHEAKRLGILLEVEGYGPLRLRRSAPLRIPRFASRVENILLIFKHKAKKIMFDLWWNLARIPIVLLKQSKKLSSLSLRLVELTGKYPGRMHPKHLVADVEPQYMRLLSKDDLVLDIGCGNGQHALKIAANVLRVVGFDTDIEQLALGTASARDKKIDNVEFRNLSAETKLPFGDGEFSAVLFLGVLEHLDNREEIIREANRVLKVGGKLLLGVPNEETSWKRLQMKFGISHYTDPDHRLEYSREGIKRFLSDHGFSISKIETTAFDTPWAGVIDLIGGISLPLYKYFLLRKQKMAKKLPDETISFFILAEKRKKS